MTQQDSLYTHPGAQRELGPADADGDPQESVSGLARRIIGQRLSRVARLLPRAANRPEKDIEYVHDLRVGARRAAGPARDLDVIGERLSRLAVAGGTTPRLAIAIDRIRGRRQRAQAPLVKAYKRAVKRSFKSKARDLPALVQWNGEGPEPGLTVWAGSALHSVLDRFVARSSVDLTDTKALHRMRIAEKRVRYSLEVLGEPQALLLTASRPSSASSSSGLERSTITTRRAPCCCDGGIGPRAPACGRCSPISPPSRSGAAATLTTSSSSGGPRGDGPTCTKGSTRSSGRPATRSPWRPWARPGPPRTSPSSDSSPVRGGYGHGATARRPRLPPATPAP